MGFYYGYCNEFQYIVLQEGYDHKLEITDSQALHKNLVFLGFICACSIHNILVF